MIGLGKSLMKNFSTVTIFLIISSLFASSSALACAKDEESTVKQADFLPAQNGCLVYRPSGVTENKVTWSGQCQNGYAQGQGITQWYQDNQPSYHISGNFIQGKLQGKGKAFWDMENACQNKSYEGTFKDSNFLGTGIVTFTDGNRFEGEMTEPNKPYRGVFIWGKDNPRFGDRYEGEFINGLMWGEGTYTWGETQPWAGDVYKGHFENNLRNGFGTYTNANGTKYVGNWKNGVEEGEGEEFKNNFYYKGNWHNYEKTGYGIAEWGKGEDHQRYEGQWLNNNINGEGKLITTTYTYQGQFEHGKFSGKGYITWNTGGWLRANFKNGQAEGEGQNKRANGILYTGNFHDGLAGGYGKLIIPRKAYTSVNRSPLGQWEGDNFIKEGWFDNNKIAFNCHSNEDCEKVAQSSPKLLAIYNHLKNEL